MEINNGHEVAAKQVILQIDATKVNTPPAAVLQQLTALTNADDFRPLSRTTGIYVLHSKTNNVTALLNILKNHPAVTFVEPDFILKPVVTPNDAGFSQQWDLYNAAIPGADIGATLAWGISTGSTANVVGVVDTGIDYTHQDLAGNIWSAPAPFTVTLSWGQLTCPAGSHGYNSITRSCNPADDNMHGTHVSGTIGAVGNNGTGVTGVNWTTRIMGLKFIDASGTGSTSDAVDAIEFGLQTKAFFGAGANLRVLSNSWGGGGASQALLNEINKANTSDVLFVVAAGNSSTNDDTTPTYPASFNTANMITVAATTNTDTLASFSNYGPGSVQLGAPGVNILSTLPNNSYGYLSGTSMATPHVSGAAMLILSRCSLNTAGLKNTILANVDPIASLQGITSTGGRLDVNKALRSCASSGTTTGSAAFVNSDSATSGSWKGVYGADGYNVINDSSSYPAYVNVTPSGNGSYTWVASTSSTRGLQKGSSPTDRIASCWYSNNSFSIDLNFSDSNPHQVGLYMLDWDFSQRAQRVDILDGNGNLLDSRSAANFTSGQYLVWNLSGHVVVRLTTTNASAAAVLSGLFFGAGGSGGGGGDATGSGTASFVKTDTTTAGTWRGVYGAEGYNVINDTASYPSYVSVSASGNSPYTWVSSTSSSRALMKGSSSTDRIAACWYSNSSFSIDLNFSDGNTHQVALYMLDWDFSQRAQRVDVLDSGGNVLDTRSAANFTNGQYLVWNLSGHVVLRLTTANPPTAAVLSGLFFGPGGSTGGSGGRASFLTTDTATSGTWKGIYGADGYNVINDTTGYPSYVSVTPAGNGSYTWLSSTTSTRGLQKASASDRLAACWYSNSSFSIDLNFNDANTHQVALYMLDWDFSQRSQRVDIVDAAGNVLDSRSISGFTNGQYLVWNMSGHVAVRLTSLNPPTAAVLSGLFFK